MNIKLITIITFAVFAPVVSMAQEQDPYQVYQDFRSALVDFSVGRLKTLKEAKEKLQTLRNLADGKADGPALAYLTEAEVVWFEGEFEEDDNPAKTASVILEKLHVLKDSREEEWKDKASKNELLLFRLIFNQGVSDFQEKRMEKALESFKVAVAASPNSPEAVLYAGYAAAELGDLAEANEFFKTYVLELGENDKYAMHSLMQHFRDEQRNMEAAETVWKLATDAYPDDKGMWMEGSNLYFRMRNNEQQIKCLRKAIEIDPEDAILITKLGNLFEVTQQPDKAKETYKQAVALNSANFEPYYSLGAYYFNIAIKKMEEKNTLPLSQIDKIIALEEEAKDLFKLAKPYLQKANELRPSHRSTKNALEIIEKWLIEIGEEK